jgi:hypothetical protein
LTAFINKISMLSSVPLTPDTFKKAVKYLGFEDEFMEIGEVEMKEINCAGCGASMKIPDGAKMTVCEYCGNTNQAGTSELKCMGCGGFSLRINPKKKYHARFAEL